MKIRLLLKLKLEKSVLSCTRCPPVDVRYLLPSSLYSAVVPASSGADCDVDTAALTCSGFQTLLGY